MLLVVARKPPPPVTVWTGRRWFAAIDALLWPAILIAGVWIAPFASGAVGLVLVAAALWFAAKRLLGALFANEHYRFTTWRWGRFTACLLMVGALLKIAASSF